MSTMRDSNGNLRLITIPAFDVPKCNVRSLSMSSLLQTYNNKTINIRSISLPSAVFHLMHWFFQWELEWIHEATCQPQLHIATTICQLQFKHPLQPLPKLALTTQTFWSQRKIAFLALLLRPYWLSQVAILDKNWCIWLNQDTMLFVHSMLLLTLAITLCSLLIWKAKRRPLLGKIVSCER